MKVQLISIVEHQTVDHRLSIFSLTEEFENGANYDIEAIHRLLNSCPSREGQSRKMYLQIDNCTQNINADIYTGIFNVFWRGMCSCSMIFKYRSCLSVTLTKKWTSRFQHVSSPTQQQRSHHSRVT